MYFFLITFLLLIRVKHVAAFTFFFAGRGVNADSFFSSVRLFDQRKNSESLKVFFEDSIMTLSVSAGELEIKCNFLKMKGLDISMISALHRNKWKQSKRLFYKWNHPCNSDLELKELKSKFNSIEGMILFMQLCLSGFLWSTKIPLGYSSG